MLRILVPVDGSDHALRALEFAVEKFAPNLGTQVDLHLLNVQPPIAQGEVRMFVGEEQIRAWQQEQGEAASSRATKLLDELDVPYTSHICVGHAIEAIASFAVERGCDLIVMGTRGLSGVMGALMGSVADGLLRRSVVPLLLVK